MSDKNDSGMKLSGIFGVIGIESSGIVESVIERALEHRDRAQESTRSRLNAAIQNSGISVPGFRDAGRASSQQLRDPVLLNVVKGNDRLAGATLISWMESQKRLMEAVSERLSERGIESDGIDARKGRFDSLWPRAEWESERDALAGEGDEFDADDVGLMLCCVSGRMPEPENMERHMIESELFAGWVRELEGLDSDAGDWLDFNLFVKTLSQIGETKREESARAQSDAIDGERRRIADEYTDEFQYLGVELGAWADVGTHHRLSTITKAREFISGLDEALGEYRPIRPQADTRKEEMERRGKREEWEDAIIESARLWGEFVAGLKEESDAEEDVAKKAEALIEQIELAKTDLAAANLEVERLRALSEAAAVAEGVSASEYESLKGSVESLTAEVARLSETNEGLEADKRDLDNQNSRLRRQLSESRRMEAVWRGSYEAERAKQAQGPEIEPSELESVTDALELADRTFPDQLLLALNSKSDKNSPFQKPDEVFTALKWLATEYHDLRTNPGGSPDFNMLLKQSCPGWSYKPGQTEVTKEQFNPWYTAWHDGKTYDIRTHLAKGTSHDPQNTMRIAFAWDDDLSKVVVGYLGLHQRNRRSA